MSEEKKSKGGVWQFIKFALFSASAGIIQILSFTLMSEVIIKLPALQNLMDTNATFVQSGSKNTTPEKQKVQECHLEFPPVGPNLPGTSIWLEGLHIYGHNSG